MVRSKEGTAVGYYLDWNPNVIVTTLLRETVHLRPRVFFPLPVNAVLINGEWTDPFFNSSRIKYSILLPQFTQSRGFRSQTIILNAHPWFSYISILRSKRLAVKYFNSPRHNTIQSCVRIDHMLVLWKFVLLTKCSFNIDKIVVSCQQFR